MITEMETPSVAVPDLRGTAAKMYDAIKWLPVQLDPDPERFFAPGIYMKQLRMPTGAYVLGRTHKTAHWNIMSQGKCLVSMNGGEAKLIEAPFEVYSAPGIQKMAYILEEVIWTTVHNNPTDEKDPDKLDDMHLIPLEEDLKLAGQKMEAIK